MRYVLAISGGVDSVVLLDVMSRTEKDIVVAHFDHGIRQDSAADARFVEALTAKYRGKRNRAKRAEIVASVLYFQKMTRAVTGRT